GDRRPAPRDLAAGALNCHAPAPLSAAATTLARCPMIQLDVPGIKSPQCATVISNAVRERDPDAQCEVDVHAKRVALDSTLPPSDFIEALEEVGYPSSLILPGV